MRIEKIVLLLLGFTLANLSNATSASTTYFQPLPDLAIASRGVGAPLMVKASKGQALLGDTEALQVLLAGDGVDLELPLPNGDTAIYFMEYSPIAEQDFLDQFPEIRTFRGTDVSNSNNRGRFDISPSGFRGMFKHNGRTVFIDPKYRNSDREYLSYYAEDAELLVPRPYDSVIDPGYDIGQLSNRAVAKGSSDGSLRTYRIAVAATAEYTAYWTNKSNAASAIASAINRINQVFEADLGITLQLVSNNSIIFTDTNTDDYDNQASDINVNRDNIEAFLDSADYDIGHVLGTGGGGRALLGSVCSTSLKASGYTGSSEPTGDAFYIDFLAHEIGHQFGANHTFNGTSLSCGGGTRNASTAYEPGSGSTIMAYAGICDDEDLQNNSDDYFHAGSIVEITGFVTTGSGADCGTVTDDLANVAPDVTAPDDFTIPAGTPFILTGTATDGDGDPLTYVWEQMDTGSASSSLATMVDNGDRAIFRSFSPASETSANTFTRYLPRLADVVADTTMLGESYPVSNRILDFRLTARDNSAGNGATGYDDTRVTVTTSAGPFLVTEPTSSTIWAPGTETVLWNVANTDISPVSCPQVDILLSTDSGVTFGTNLLLATDNDGTEDVTVPSGVSGTVRVMVRCSDNRFYAISGTNPNVTFVEPSSPSSSGGGGGNVGAMLTLMLFLMASYRRRWFLL